ncbi:cytochrome P450 [Aspergillus pseudocaelatus]|uniref:Cytochrome P450 n=1 Tax=Aspergillus pseudocaelatus TaxID=1825620 RepID=A0ABQ6WV55_9EURO|nr:cytochrome P450 [Aspergillus pseudocaelatus]
MSLGLEIPSITFLIAFAVGGCAWLRYLKRPLPRTPPIISLTRDERKNGPVEALERQIKQHGPVIGLHRDGRVEYIVSDELTPRVLTEDATFSFELGTAKILNLEFLPKLFGNSIFQDIDSAVNTLLTKHLDTMIHRGRELLPSFDRDTVVDTAEGVAELIGTFRSRSMLAQYFPVLWQIVTWIKVVIYTVVIRFGFAFGPLIWKQISVALQDSNKKPPNQNVSLLRILVQTSGAMDGHITFRSRLWIFGLVVMFIFASVHQTVSITMWTIFQLALHSEYQDIIRREIHDLTSRDTSQIPISELDMRTLRKASRTDSFIREVLRMKGDAVNLVRMARKDVQLGDYIVPKGSLILPLVSLSNRSPRYNEGDLKRFDGMRWVEKQKAASTTDPGHLSFGLGRWACPGRFLAVAEIKLAVFALLADTRLELVGGRYDVADKFNITGNPPEGQLVFKRINGC